MRCSTLCVFLKDYWKVSSSRNPFPFETFRRLTSLKNPFEMEGFFLHGAYCILGWKTEGGEEKYKIDDLDFPFQDGKPVFPSTHCGTSDVFGARWLCRCSEASFPETGGGHEEDGSLDLGGGAGSDRR